VQAVASDRGHGVWIGERDGVAHFNGTRWSFYTSADGLGGDDVRAITVAPDGAAWFGTENGLTYWGKDQTATYRFTGDERWNRVTALQELGEDLWVGTQGGLVQISPAGETYYTRADGLPGDFVTALAADPSGRLWIGTWGGGVAVFEEGQRVSYAFSTGRYNYVLDLAVGGNKVWMMSPSGLMIFDLETEAWTPYQKITPFRASCRTVNELMRGYARCKCVLIVAMTTVTSPASVPIARRS